MMKSILVATILSLVATFAYADGHKQVYIINLQDGDVVQGGEVEVLFGLKGMGVAPAGVEKANTGHHHILLDREVWGKGEDDADMMEDGIYADENHIHFGKGQTQTTLKLPKGKHTIQLVLGDQYHVPIKGMTSERITIEVK